MNANYNGWFVLYVKSRHEKKVHNLLQESSLESFLPLVKTKRQWSDRKKTVIKPLFPSYVFVNIQSSMDFYKALGVNGACTYIRFGKEYARVTENEIIKIKLLLGLKDVTDLNTKIKLPKVGEIRKITCGTLKDMECEVLRINNDKTILVNIGIHSLRQDITAVIPSYYL